MRKALSAVGRVGTVALIAVLFATGLAGTVYLSLRSPETQVPEVVNKPFKEGEAALASVGLGIRERAKRFKPGVEPGVVLDQSPRPGEVVKVGQTVAVVVSRPAREGERGFEEQAAGDEKKDAKDAAPKNANENSSANAENQNRARPANRNANRNANANAARNANGQNANGDSRNADATNANRGANVNGNRGANANRNAAGNRNAGDNANANRSRNTNARPSNGNANAGRNANTGRTNTNARPSNSGNANRRPPLF